MLSFPLLDLLLILLALLMVAVVAEGLKVRPVIEPVAADRPRLDMVHAGRRPDDSLPLAFSAKRMLCPESPGQSGPPVCVVWIGRPVPDILSIIPFPCSLGVPR